jgi:hypothetical protein
MLLRNPERASAVDAEHTSAQKEAITMARFIG